MNPNLDDEDKKDILSFLGGAWVLALLAILAFPPAEEDVPLSVGRVQEPWVRSHSFASPWAYLSPRHHVQFGTLLWRLIGASAMAYGIGALVHASYWRPKPIASGKHVPYSNPPLDLSVQRPLSGSAPQPEPLPARPPPKPIPPLSPEELLARLRTLGVRLDLSNGALHVRAPSGVLTPELRSALALHRREISLLLWQEVL
jgi:hypothetical protein